MSLDPAVRARIEALLAANPVVLFMKGNPRAPQCGFSSKAVGALDATGVTYAHVDVLADPEIREGIKAYGEWPTIPQLYIGGELVQDTRAILLDEAHGYGYTGPRSRPPERPAQQPTPPPEYYVFTRYLCPEIFSGIGHTTLSLMNGAAGNFAHTVLLAISLQRSASDRFDVTRGSWHLTPNFGLTD